MPRVLLVDDEPKICQILSLLLRTRGYDVAVANSGERAVALAKQQLPDVVLMDVSLPNMDGIEAFIALRQMDSELAGVFMTAHGSIPSAIAAMRAGGFDYLTKPFDNEELLMTLGRALEARQLRQEVRTLREEVSGRQVFAGYVGTSPAMQACVRMISKIARTDTTVLILGESGTGKELAARSLHRQSRRASGPFIPVNCSAIPAGLVESEFFGHERGAFTDAKEARVGRFEQAHGGTIFLDEVGDLPLEAQAKLLRVLEDRHVTRLSGRRPIPIDVRVISATNRDLVDAVERGAFREDLYWRLNVMSVRLPALRERADDLVGLIDYLIDRLNVELGSSISVVSADARARLIAHDWPGNIRELENALRHAMVLADSDSLELTNLPSRFTDAPTERLSLSEAVDRAASRVERALIVATLAEKRGNRNATAEALGINRRTLFTKMRLYGLTEDTEHEPN